MILEPARLEFSQIQADELETFSSLICAVAQELEDQGQPLWDQEWLQPQALLEKYGLESIHLGRINTAVFHLIWTKLIST